MLESGVKFYTKAYLKTPLYFPEQELCCWYCLLFNKHTEECRMTNETIFKPKLYVGWECPLEWEGRNE